MNWQNKFIGYDLKGKKEDILFWFIRWMAFACFYRFYFFNKSKNMLECKFKLYQKIV